MDTPGKIAALCAKGIRPKPGDPTIPSVAAICIYPARVADAREHLGSSGVRVASVATAFPSGQSLLSLKIAETQQAAAAGADEVDMVIDRGAFLSGDYQKVYAARGDASRQPRDDGGHPRFRPRDGQAGGVQACRRHQDFQAGDRVPRRLVRDARP